MTEGVVEQPIQQTYGPMDNIPPTNAIEAFGSVQASYMAPTQTVQQLEEVEQQIVQNVEAAQQRNEQVEAQKVVEYQDGMALKDSGDRREFASGAHRDMAKGKGRCDLLPMTAIVYMLPEEYKELFNAIHRYQQTGDITKLEEALSCASKLNLFEMPAVNANGVESTEVAYAATILLEVAKHFEAGAEKYGDNNWQKGIPTSVYLDSAIRHLLKYIRGDSDEPHNRAFVWNLLCCLWTEQNRPECRSYAK